MKKHFIILGLVVACLASANILLKKEPINEIKKNDIQLSHEENKQEKWTKAVKKTSENYYFSGLNIEITEHSTDESGSPLSAIYKNGTCYVNVDTVYNGKQLANYIEYSAEENLTEILEAISVHEFAHCFHMQQNAFYMASLRNAQSQSTKDGSELLKSEMLTRREETFADSAALTYMQDKHPEKFNKIIDFFINMRSQKSYTHGILESIKYIREHGIKKTDDYFQSAEEITQKIDNNGLL